MKPGRMLALLAALALPAPAAMAEGWREKLATGAAKTATAAKNSVRQLDQTVGSTIQLATGEATPQLTREKLDAMANDSLLRLFAEYPGSREQFDLSAGYAVFDTRKSVLLGIAGGFGRGVAVSLPLGQRTYMKMATGGVGLSLGLGGFESQVVILFETPRSFETFVYDGFDASAQTGAMVGYQKAGSELRFIDGRSIFVLSKQGWKVSATAAGTKYWRDDKLN